MNGGTCKGAIEGAEAAGVSKVVLISATMPQWAPKGYRDGKMLAEEAATLFQRVGLGGVLLIEIHSSSNGEATLFSVLSVFAQGVPSPAAAGAAHCCDTAAVGCVWHTACRHCSDPALACHGPFARDLEPGFQSMSTVHCHFSPLLGQPECPTFHFSSSVAVVAQAPASFVLRALAAPAGWLMRSAPAVFGGVLDPFVSVESVAGAAASAGQPNCVV